MILQKKTNDNNKYIIVGFRYYWAFPVSPERDVWIMEINSSNGNIVKEKHYGGNKNDGAKRIIANDDGSYFVIGVTSSYGTDNTQNVWLLKLNSFLDTL